MSRESLVGTTLAGYEIRSVVGEGGTSAVYRADHPTHGTVALKVLRDRLRQDRTAVQRFVREAQYGGRVLHPNVVRTIEIGEAEPGLHFLAIEWAGGEILEKYAKKHCPIPAPEVADIVGQIAAAVQAAHDAGIVHRDLKPENVMYDPASRQVKLLDFGIAAEADQSADERLTRAGFFVGTLMYVAPEALSGEMVTAAADQYSLATIAYFLLSGCHPYSGKSPREMFTQLLSQPPLPLGKAKEGLLVSPAVEAVVMKGLSKSPADRYPDVKSFAAALRGALDAPAPEPPKGEAGVFGKLKGLFKR
ncbi:serine/threonine-protein kinase [Roseisolibacter sp. H3M3-2]|uniref:serine/threonine-protein kinase n=1 Tax=Roseisolibacter sp. H3M3-2 TaxID=3031323 RepID=UPI0023DC67A8|nr:serine/threonine-protein kinase [Roseisolibacter sp. H3M3-2]MDF1505608.1 serine/threonine-protein kinase [Roseisolibacter sp. H3M3-2]